MILSAISKLIIIDLDINYCYNNDPLTTYISTILIMTLSNYAEMAESEIYKCKGVC